MASLETKVDNLDVDKLKTDPTGLSNLSNIVDNDVAKNAVYDKLVININVSDTKVPSTSGLVTKTQYYSDKQGLGKKIKDVAKKIPNTSGLVKKTD